MTQSPVKLVSSVLKHSVVPFKVETYDALYNSLGNCPSVIQCHDNTIFNEGVAISSEYAQTYAVQFANIAGPP